MDKITDRSSALPTVWWVVANPERGWGWEKFFNDPYPVLNFRWSSPWIRSTLSLARIREMIAGDKVIAYQAGARIVMGLARLQSDSFPENRPDSFDLDKEKFIRLNNAIPLNVVKGLKGVREHIEFVRIPRGTVTRVTVEGVRLLAA